MAFSPFDILTAEEMNDLVENIEALAAGTGLNDGVVTPSKRAGGFAVGVIPNATLGTTGNKPITGVGFMPKMVRFTVLPVTNSTASTTGNGVMSTTSQFATSTASIGGSTLARASITTGAILWIGANGATSLVASYVSMNADGFTINVTTASNAFAVGYEAYA